MKTEINELVEPKEKMTADEYCAWLKELSKQSRLRTAKAKVISTWFKLMTEQQKILTPEEFDEWDKHNTPDFIKYGSNYKPENEDHYEDL